MAVEVTKVELKSVQDASGLEERILAGQFTADQVVAVVGKTEGNGGVNDFTRIIADRAFREVLMAKGSRSADEVAQVPIVWSGGTDGVISPHATIFATVPADRITPSDEPRLTVGFAMSEPLLPEDIGRTPMISKVAEAVRNAMAQAGVTDAADVHYVQTKTPLLTIDTIRDAKSRGKTVWTEDTLHSMDLSNGTTALGIAVALGEIDMPTDDDGSVRLQGAVSMVPVPDRVTLALAPAGLVQPGPLSERRHRGAPGRCLGRHVGRWSQ
jgi:cyanuric acid amidohydrolase